MPEPQGSGSRNGSGAWSRFEFLYALGLAAKALNSQNERKTQRLSRRVPLWWHTHGRRPLAAHAPLGPRAPNMQVTCAYGGAAAQGGSAACARKERPQLQEAQLGVCGAEDTARADRLEDVPSSAARDNHQSPQFLAETKPRSAAAMAHIREYLALI